MPSLQQVNQHLDAAGIGHDVDTRLNAGIAVINQFIAMAHRRITAQFAFDLLRNAPTGSLPTADYTGDRAIRRAVPGIVGELVKWDIGEALDVAADIAEDVNAHAEADAIRALFSNPSSTEE